MAGLDDRVAKATVDGTLDGPGTAVVRIAGDLDLSTVLGVTADLEPFVQAAPDRIAFDLSSVSFMDSSGIAVLLRVVERVAFVEVRNPSSAVQLIVRATGLSDVFHIDR